MTQEEIWEPVAVYGYQDLYEASNLGHIRREGTNRNLKPSSNKRAGDRLHVCLSSNGHVRTFYVHVLVAEAFYGPKPTGLEINHIDLDYQNNILENLEYVTHSDNQKHSVKAHGTWGSMNVKRFTERETELIRELYEEVKNYAAIAKVIGVSEMTVRRVIIGRDGRNY